MKPCPTCTLKIPQIRNDDYIKNLGPINWAKISAYLLVVGLKLHGIAKGISLVNVFHVKKDVAIKFKKDVKQQDSMQYVFF